MAYIASAAAGNWSAPATWTGGVVPGNGDSAIIKHAVKVDVNTVVGPSAKATTGDGTAAGFALLVQGTVAGNLIGGPYSGNGFAGAGLTVAPGVTFKVRGDTFLSSAPATVSGGATWMCDSSQSATPATDVYVIEVVNGSLIAGVLNATGAPGNRATIMGNVAGGGAPCRITGGEVFRGYPSYSGGMLNLSYCNLSWVGTASLPMATCRLTDPATYSIKNCRLDHCGVLTSFYVADKSTTFTIENNTWTNSVDTTHSYNNSPPGMSAALIGTCITFGWAPGTPASGSTQVISGNFFDKCVSLAAFGGSLTQCVISGNVFAGFLGFDTYCGSFTCSGNLIYQACGYTGGGDSLAVPWGGDFANNYYIQDSPLNINSHMVSVIAGHTGLPGPGSVRGNIFEVSQMAAGYWGGNCLILHVGPAGGTTATNVLTISGNIVLPSNQTTQDASASAYAGYGHYIAAGTLITILDVNPAICNASYRLLNNTCCIPYGIGSLDPDENCAGGAGEFAEIRSNIFWMDAAAYSANPSGVGYAVWWNTNSHGRVPTIDECRAENITNNCFLNVRAGTVSYIGLDPASPPASFAAAAPYAVQTYGYSDGWFSSTTPPGANDVGADPHLNDYDRNTWKFDTAMGGPGTIANMLAQMALMNEDSGWNPSYSVANLVKWVRNGFIPTNVSIKGMGYGGADPGAVPILLPLVWTTPAGSIGNWTAGAAVAFSFVAGDPNAGTTLTFSANGLPAWLALSAAGALSGTAAAVTTDTTYPFSITATDGTLVSTVAFSLTVKAWVAPAWNTGAALGSYLAGTTQTFTLSTTDAQGAAVTYALASGSTLPGSMQLTTGGVLSGALPLPSSDTVYSFGVVATNGHVPATRAFALTVRAYVAPAWVTAAGSLGSFRPGAAAIQVSASDPQSQPLTYAVAPPLPGFLALDAPSGRITGVFPPAGTSTPYAFSITASDGVLSTARAFSITAAPYLTPSWTTPAGALTPAASGVAYSASVAATDPQGLTVAYSAPPGTLPAGLSLNAATGAISGTPDEVSSTVTVNFTVTASNGYTSAAQAFSIVVAASLPAWITPAGALAGATAGAAYSAALAAASTYPLTYSAPPGALPGGLSLNAATGVISGTPAEVATATTASFTVTADDGKVTAARAFSIAVAPATPAWTTPAGALAAATAGVAYAGATLAAASPFTLTYSVPPGTLPAGLSLNAATGAISGTPAEVATATTASFTVTASDGTASASRAFSIAVAPNGPVWTTAAGALAAGSPGAAYTGVTLAASSPFPLTYTVPANTLPAGLSLNAATGAIIGTPAALGTASFTVTVSDGVLSATRNFSIQIAATPPAWTTPSGSLGTVGAGVATAGLAATATNVTGYALTSGGLPPGLTLNTTTGAISGTPAEVAAATAFTFTVTAANAWASSPQTFSITVTPATPAWTTPAGALAAATPGVAYSARVAAASIFGLAYTISGSLPAGLALNGATGAISGTPAQVTAPATASFTVTASDGTASAARGFSIAVAPNPPAW